MKPVTFQLQGNRADVLVNLSPESGELTPTQKLAVDAFMVFAVRMLEIVLGTYRKH